MTTYRLVSENLTHLGGPMGTEYTTTNWTKYFSSFDKAKTYARKDYKGDKDWNWLKEKIGVRSPDLGYVMYHISPVKVEN